MRDEPNVKLKGHSTANLIDEYCVRNIYSLPTAYFPRQLLRLLAAEVTPRLPMGQKKLPREGEVDISPTTTQVPKMHSKNVGGCGAGACTCGNANLAATTLASSQPSGWTYFSTYAT
jgi:hypothetical protein